MLFRTLFTAAAGLAAALVSTAPASAAPIVPVSAIGSSEYSSYPAADAIDGSVVTDWAAASTGAGSYLDLDLGAVYALAAVSGYDRTTSGSSNGAFVGGTTDFTTSYTIQAYTDATFTTTQGLAYTFGKPTPTGPTTIDSFFFTNATPGLTGEFIRYTVNTTNGPNPGLAEISFAAVPEPTTRGMMLLGFGLMGLGLRGRRAAKPGFARA